VLFLLVTLSEVIRLRKDNEMPRSCISNSEEKLFDADKCCSDLEQNILSVAYVVGIADSLESGAEIDDFILALRETFSTKDSSTYRNQAHDFITQNYAVLLQKVQVSFFNLKLAKYGATL